MPRPTDAELLDLTVIDLLLRIDADPDSEILGEDVCAEIRAAADALSQRADPSPAMIERAADAVLEILPESLDYSTAAVQARAVAETALRAALTPR